MSEVKLSAPVTTSNLGPGFDTLGLALGLRLEARAWPLASGLELEVEYAGPAAYRGPLEDMIRTAIRGVAEAAGDRVSGLGLAIKGRVPLARGLGSSALYRVLGAGAANELWGRPLTRPGLIELASRLERHTDNAVPTVAGGFTISGWDGDRVRFRRLAAPSGLRFVALIPDRALPTEQARAVLPELARREDAVFNLQRAIWLALALAEGRAEELKGAFADRLHQPYRERLMPFLPAVIEAAEAAGAHGAFLSGAGTTVIAIADPAVADGVGDAMLAALRGSGETGLVRVLSADNGGLVIEE